MNKTREQYLWSAINQRCAGESGDTYRQCRNGFKNLQHFKMWCVSQVGFYSKNPNDTFWALDKDIILPGNKVYNADNCAFVPQELNSLFKTGYRQDAPIGVSWHKASGKWASRITLHGKTKHLGLYTTPTEAHAVWQLHKVRQLESLDLSQFVLDDRVLHGIQLHIHKLQEDIKHGRESVL